MIRILILTLAIVFLAVPALADPMVCIPAAELSKLIASRGETLMFRGKAGPENDWPMRFYVKRDGTSFTVIVLPRPDLACIPALGIDLEPATSGPGEPS